MTTDGLLGVIAIGCALATMVLVVAGEAFSAVSRARVADLAADGNVGAARLLRLLPHRARYVNGLLFARITTSTFAVVAVTILALRMIPEPSWLGPLVAGLVMLLVGYAGFGVAAQTIGQQRADRVAIAWRWLASACFVLFGWLASAMIHFGNAVTPGRGYRQGPFATQSELRELVDLAEADHVIEAGERQMIHSVFELGGTTARAVMVPRTEIVWVDARQGLKQALEVALQSGFSRIPVAGRDLDDIVGVLYLKDIVSRTVEGGDAAAGDVSTAMRLPMFVPDSKPIDDLLRDMQAARVHLAIAVDEFGGTAGLVTIEDILEEIVGEIADEYDRGEQPSVVKLGSGAWRITPRLSLDDLADATGMDLSREAESVDTVAGLIALHLGSVPVPGSTVTVRGFRFIAEAGTGGRGRIQSIAVTAERAPAPPAGAEQ